MPARTRTRLSLDMASLCGYPHPCFCDYPYPYFAIIRALILRAINVTSRWRRSR
jgi:hypothetical protein